MRRWQLDQRGEIIRHLPRRVIFSSSPVKTRNLAGSIVCNDALLAVLVLLRPLQRLLKLGQAGTMERYCKELCQDRLLAAHL